jgi:hypothetical protein
MAEKIFERAMFTPPSSLLLTHSLKLLEVILGSVGETAMREV